MALYSRNTKRLIIRPLTKDDFQAWKKYHLTKKDAQNKWDLPKIPSSEITKSNFLRIVRKRDLLMKDRRSFYLYVFEKKSNNLIGSISIMDIIYGVTASGYIGYSIHNQYWNKGYASESIVALIDIAFKDLELHRLEAGIERYNIRSIRLIKKLNFRKEGLKKEMVYLRGQWRDLLIYAATCDELGYKWKG